jgi:hypothetical protein
MVTFEFATHRHVKTGRKYVLIGYGNMQTEGWMEVLPKMASVDMAEVAVYRSVEDASLWVRPKAEWDDGRFEEL